MNAKIKLSIALIAILVSCQRPKENKNIEGVWIQEGYGRLLSIKDATYTYFNTTEHTCLPLIANGILADRFRVVDFKNDKLILNPGGIVDYHFKRTDKLPEICSNKNTKPDRSVEVNFNVLWHTFNKHYAFFEQRHIDWNNVKTQSQIKLKDIQTDSALYELFVGIFSTFNDGHVKLDVPESLAISTNSNKNRKKGKSKHEVINDISAAYVNQLKRYNNGVIQWGTLKDENMGYIVITDMNNFSNYVAKPNLSSRQFWEEYETVLETKSGLIQLDDELKGVDFIMNTILSDLAKTQSIIIDLRFNGGGYETVALQLLSHFVKQPKHILSIKAKKGQGYTKNQKYVLKPATNVYEGKVIVLTSHSTASAAEIFALGTVAYPKIKRFGSSTNGIFSEILWKNLPNGWEFSLSNEVYSDPNGNIYEITGVPPNYDIDYPEDRNDFYNTFYEGDEFKDIGIEKVITWHNQVDNRRLHSSPQ